MKKIYFQTITILFVLIATILPVATSCTHPDGKIGMWAGTWLFERITVDGVPDTSYPGSDDRLCMMSIQGKIFTISQVEQYEIFGNWKSGDMKFELTADFSIYDNALGWPPQLGFGEFDNPLTFRIIQRDSKKMRLSLDCADGHTREYYLRRL